MAVTTTAPPAAVEQPAPTWPPPTSAPAPQPASAWPPPSPAPRPAAGAAWAPPPGGGGPTGGVGYALPAYGAPGGTDGPPSASTADWGRYLLIAGLLAAILVGVGIGIAALLGSSTPSTVPTGPGTASITWNGVAPSKSGYPGPQPFTGTIAGVPVSGTTVALPNGFPHAGGTLPTDFVFYRVSGTLGGTPFSIDLIYNVAPGGQFPTGHQMVSLNVVGTYGTEPVRGTISGPANASTANFTGTVGSLHVSGTLPPAMTHNGMSSAMSPFTVSG